MAGPTQQITRKIIIQPGETRTEYNPASLAYLVQNLELTLSGTLKSIVGPAILRTGTRARPSLVVDNVTDVVRAGAGTLIQNDRYWNTERPHSIFFASLNSGSASILLYRFGGRLLRFLGDQSTTQTADEVLLSGLSDTTRATFPDQYVLLQDRVIWTNGIDAARVISFDGNVVPLGFDAKPSPPEVLGPEAVPFTELQKFFPNGYGYSWPGRIGTAGEDLSGESGSLLSGTWYYRIQYEDVYGNLSPFSAASSPIILRASQADPYGFQASEEENPPSGASVDDLTRRFIVRTGGSAPSHAVATHIYRTPDTLHVDKTPRLLVRVPGSTQLVYGDNHSDSDLGSQWEPTIRVPVFRVAAAHQGRLVIGNTPAKPGIVRRSEPGFAGTFSRNDFVFPDSGGAEITGLIDHRGVLLAFTEKTVYSLADFSNPVPLSQGIGCVAPNSIGALRDGTLIWLGRDGFYGMRELGNIQRLSAPIDSIMRRHVNRSRLRMATASVDADSGEYRCALAPAGSVHNNLILTFDGHFWRRQRLGLHIADTCVTDDWRGYTLAIGTDLVHEYDITQKSSVGPKGGIVAGQQLDFSRVFVMNRQTSDYYAPPRSIIYRSGWLRFSEEGLLPAHVRSMYIGMLDAWDGYATVRIYKEGSWVAVNEMTDVRLVGVDRGSSIVSDVAGRAVVGQAKTHNPRLFWRELPVGLQNVTSWAFEIELVGDPHPDSGDELGRMHLAAFAFDTSVATQGQPLGRVPRRNDT